MFGGISAEKIAIALSSKVEVNPKNITVEPIILVVKILKNFPKHKILISLRPLIEFEMTVFLLN